MQQHDIATRRAQLATLAFNLARLVCAGEIHPYDARPVAEAIYAVRDALPEEPVSDEPEEASDAA